MHDRQLYCVWSKWATVDYRLKIPIKIRLFFFFYQKLYFGVIFIYSVPNIEEILNVYLKNKSSHNKLCHVIHTSDSM